MLRAPSRLVTEAFLYDNQTVDMVRHDHIGVQHHVRLSVRGKQPLLFYNRSNSGQVNIAIHYSPEDTPSSVGARRHEVDAGPGVVKTW
jgi:hypothetical protein